MNWIDCELGDVLTLKRGYDLPARMRKEGTVPVVSSSGVTGSHSEAKVRAPAVVTGRYGTLGHVYFLDRDCWPLNTALYVVDFKDTHPRFAAYFLRNALRDFRSDKAAVPGVDRNVLHRFDVRVPDLTAQKAIAAILSTYDHSIENNRRRIQLLERTARLLYKEWFVHLRFPGHDRTTITDGVPEGWERRTLNSVATIIMGQSPKSRYYNEDRDGLPFHQGVRNFGHRFPVHRVYSTAGNRIANGGDILFSVRAPVGRINIAPDRLVLGRGIASLRSRMGHQAFLYYALKSHFVREDMMGSGTVFAAITKRDLHQVLLLHPPQRLVQKFVVLATPIDKQVQVLHRSIENLSQVRDLLLPRLMNGEISL